MFRQYPAQTDTTGHLIMAYPTEPPSKPAASPGHKEVSKDELLPLEALAHLVRQDTICQTVQTLLDRAVQCDLEKVMRRAAEYLATVESSTPKWEVTAGQWESLTRTVKVKWLKCGFHRIGGPAAAEARRQAWLLLEEHQRLLKQLHRTEKQARIRMDRLLTEMWERVPVSSAALSMLRLQHRISTSNRFFREGQRHTSTCVLQLESVEEVCAELCSRAAQQSTLSFAIVPTVDRRYVSLRCDEELN